MSRTKPDDLYFPMMDRQNKLGGVTIRAEFAKAAMQGMLSNPKYAEVWDPTALAIDAIKCADALIEALNVGHE